MSRVSWQLGEGATWWPEGSCITRHSIGMDAPVPQGAARHSIGGARAGSQPGRRGGEPAVRGCRQHRLVECFQRAVLRSVRDQEQLTNAKNRSKVKGVCPWTLNAAV